MFKCSSKLWRLANIQDQDHETKAASLIWSFTSVFFLLWNFNNHYQLVSISYWLACSWWLSPPVRHAGKQLRASSPVWNAAILSITPVCTPSLKAQLWLILWADTHVYQVNLSVVIKVCWLKMLHQGSVFYWCCEQTQALCSFPNRPDTQHILLKTTNITSFK